MKAPKASAYLRVSTSDQSVDNQLPAIKSWCESHGYALTEIYSENESAWKAGHQKELSRLLSDLRDGKKKYDILLVWALDRLSRQGSAAILNLVNTFHVYGVKVISLQETWTELPGELGEVLFAIAGWVSRMESQRRSERVRAGLARVRVNGTKSGVGIGKRGKDKGKRRRAGYLNRYMQKDIR